MTVEQTTTITIADLSHVIVTCRCGADISLRFDVPPSAGHSPQEMLGRQVACPCGIVLWSSDAQDYTRDFLSALFAARRHQSQLPVKLAISQVKS